MSVPMSDVLMEEMSLYAVKHCTKPMLEDYLRRVVLNRPTDVVGYLLEEIASRPYVPPPALPEVDSRTEEEQKRHLDLRRPKSKADLLQEVFALFSKGKSKVRRGDLLAGLAANPTLLLERFPLHHTDLLLAVEAMPTDAAGLVSAAAFETGGMACLGRAGGLPLPPPPLPRPEGVQVVEA
jgi:hypothetical protein